MFTPSRSSTLFSEADAYVSPPSVSRLYNDAAEFERLLAHSGCIESPTSENGDDSFARFIGRDLAESEPPNHIYAEPEEFVPGTLPVVREDVKWPLDELAISKPPPPPPMLLDEKPALRESWNLDPDVVVRLMIEEFGSLAPDGEEEKLLMDVDGCLIGGVLIVGSLHLTSHRLAFHASLCTGKCRPGLATSSEVPLKSGTTILHQKKWRSRRRVWLELSSDMLCVYRTSGHDATSQPLCSILFGLIDQVLPSDAERPTYLKLMLGTASQKTSIIFEFDSVISAQEWRRELRGAHFLSRHQRRNRPNPASSQNTVRFSCPLNRIDLTSSGPFLDALTRISLHFSFTHLDVALESAGLLGAQVLQVGVLKTVPLASKLAYLIAAAKHRPNVDISKSPVCLDLGPFSFAEQEVRSTITCSDLGTRESPSSRAHENTSRLWFCPARLLSIGEASGYLVVTTTHIGFWRRDLTRCLTYFLFSTIESAEPFRTAICHLNGMSLRMNGYGGKKYIKLAFDCAALRDEAMYRILPFVHGTASEKPLVAAKVEAQHLLRQSNATGIVAPLSRSLATAVKANLPMDVKLQLPKAINIPSDVIGKRPPLHFVCLTIGSRGDVQPYIALGLGLKNQGHRVTIVTHEEYKSWVENFGIQHRVAGGDPGRLMKLSVENKMFSPEFFKKTVNDYRSWLDELLADAWEACKDAEVLLESPPAMAGVHIAEALGVPYIRTFTMPWTKTSEFPHPFLSPPGGSQMFNSASYVLFNNVLWRATSGQVNRWRKIVLALDETDMGHGAQSKLTYIYDFSQAIVPKPLDWGDNIIISGYWFLDNADVDWIPPLDLLQWIEQARSDGKPIVYIGFGSITMPRPNRVLAQIVNAVTQSGVRAIISRGWSTRMSNTDDLQEVMIPSYCYMIDQVPHDWLFPRIDVAMHHGGAGTTGASLRAGIPTLIRPWFGDQFFWASRVERLGVGVKLNSFRARELSDALVRATTDQAMREKAAQAGTKIRTEDGVHTAIYAIYSRLDNLRRQRSGN